MVQPFHVVLSSQLVTAERQPVLFGLFIFSNIKNAAGNIAGTLPDDFGSGSDENKNMYRESE